MRKDELKSADFCPDCVSAEDPPVESEADGTEECCCCCCSCSDTGSDSENTSASTFVAENQSKASLEQKKKELLSSLSILRTNREPVSIQNVLQFIEALSNSPEFLRRYNLEEDFCMECLLSEPTCTCCIDGISQLNINYNSCDSCEECNETEENRNERHNSQDCTACASSGKMVNPAAQGSTNRRGRRRRRRQRNSRHVLPRVSTQPTRSDDVPFSSCFQQSNSCGSDCLDCQADRNFAECGENQIDSVDHHDSSCEECAREEALRQDCRFQPRRNFASYRTGANQNSHFCEDCARENVSSRSCLIPGCQECETKSQLHQSSSNSSERNDDPELSCSCCDSYSAHDCNPVNRNGNSKRQKLSEKPECDQSDACSMCSEQGKDQSAECSCEDCQENSECSDQSCDDCKMHSTKTKKKKK